MRLNETLKPTIAMIRGYCIGGGLATALSCDIRIAAEGSRFGIPAAKLGLGYAYDGIRKLIDIVGPAYAREIFYTARQFTSDEALAMGSSTASCRATNWKAMSRTTATRSPPTRL